MGLFDHCEIMLDQKLLDSGIFEEIYRYTILNIKANKRIGPEKLKYQADKWRRFLARMNRTRL
jgi:hypothetical protein